MTHRDGVPRLSARSAWRGDAGHRKPCAPSECHGQPESLGKPPFRPGGRTGSGRIGAGVGKPRRRPAGPAASLLPAQWPARWPARWSARWPARSLWVIISAPWYQSPLAFTHGVMPGLDTQRPGHKLPLRPRGSFRDRRGLFFSRESLHAYVGRAHSVEISGCGSTR